MSIPFETVAFYLLATLTLGFAGFVAFGRNIVYSAFGLLGCFTGVAGLYVLLAADFVGVIQLFVYVGGITVLIIFAVMLTNEIGDVAVTNQSMNWKAGVLTAGVMFYLLTYIIRNAPWKILESPLNAPTTAAIGDQLLTKYLLPFELISLVLLVALLGAIVIARKEIPRKEHPVTIGLNDYLIVAAALFCLGAYTICTRKSAVAILMGIELVLNSAGLNLIAFSHFTSPGYDGHIFTVFLITLAAAEATVALAIVVGIYMNFRTTRADEANLLRD